LAARLKKSTLRRDSDSVTFTFSSRRTSASGAGRKSSTTRSRPISPAVYLFVVLRIGFSAVMPGLDPGIHPEMPQANS